MSTLSSHRPLTRIVLDTLLAYFYPVTRHFRTNLRLERVYKVSGGARDHLASAYQFAGKIASHNQSAIIGYVFSLAERHKALRIALENNGDVKSAEVNLIRLMNEDFFHSVSINFKLLHEHFLQRTSEGPHISIRGNWRTEDRECIITIFRDREVSGDHPFDLSESTSISHSAKTGRHFICNDIPRALIDGDYLSPRLFHDRARAELSRTMFPLRRSTIDRKWRDFWVSADESEKFAYRSNLTVPILIHRDKLTPEALEKFKVGLRDKIIFGYLCFDHYKSDFFDEKLDLPVANTISDLISIFAFQRLRFTDFSTTFRQAERVLGADFDENLRASMEEIAQSIRESTHQPSPFTISKSHENASDDPDDGTVLLNADEMLVSLSEEMPLVTHGQV